MTIETRSRFDLALDTVNQENLDTALKEIRQTLTDLTQRKVITDSWLDFWTDDPIDENGEVIED